MKFLKVFLAALLAVVVGGVLSSLLWIFIFIGLAGSMESTTVVKPNSVLVVDLAEDITDAPSANPLGAIDFNTMTIRKQLSLLQVLRSVKAAESDERIKGIYLRLNGTGAVDIAAIEELRTALEEFKQSGKFIVSFNEGYSQASYYLASVANKIYLQPEGSMSWQGLSSTLIFYTGLFDKLDISVDIFRPTACKYKSAVEPYFLKQMSPDNRRQMAALGTSTWEVIVDAVSEARGIDKKTLNTLADKLAVTMPAEALKHKFVDGLIYEDQMNDVFKEFGVELDSDGECAKVTLGEYAAQVVDLQNISADKIAIVYAEGQILDGTGEQEAIYGQTMAETIKSVRLDDKVKAVVLRVNSPGGSALASDVIWREIELMKAEKPVVISMGSVAASGGYYISAPGDVIVANKMTLTGSIGVFGMIMNPNKMLTNKVGLTFDSVSTNSHSTFGSLGHSIDATERAVIMKSVDKVYERFTGLVSEGRNLPIAKVLDIAAGRVWTGVQAQENGLVDTLGGLNAAIALAADKADLETYRVNEVLSTEDPFAAILSGLGAKVRASVLRSEMGSDTYVQYNKVKSVVSQNGVMAMMPYEIRFE
ncbi:MAG: signal peptide peptidase SppA [Rikenellaceae bacterium]|nr:signal peptide peptidase SppA [Rikenellaceae bacterium]